MTRSGSCFGPPSWWGWLDVGPRQIGVMFCVPCLDHVRSVDPWIDSFEVTEAEFLVLEVLRS